MSEITTSVQMLVPVGAMILAGDEFYDDDFRRWAPVPMKMIGKVVGRHDIVKRPTFNLASLVEQFIHHVDELRQEGAGKTPSQKWWERVDATTREAKRRLGIKTIDEYQRD